MATARQQFGKHTPITMDMHPIIEELLEAMFSVQSVTRIYNKDQTEISGQQ